MLTPCSEIRCTYPLCLPRSGVDADDLHRYRHDLDSRATDLFAADETICNVELREYTPGGPSRPNGTATVQAVGDVRRARSSSSPQSNARPSDNGKLSAPFSVSTAKILRPILEREMPMGSTRVFAIHRVNSWSRMQITSDMFRTLCAASKTTPKMIDLIRGVRYKLAPEDEHYMNCFYDIDCIFRISAKTENELLTAPRNDLGFQVCYNLRYFEKHGRDLQDPWSCRQSVVHHRHRFSNALSSWIVVQPSIRWQTALDDVHMNVIVHPLSLHLRSLSSAIANNWEYLEYLSAQLLFLDKRAAFPKPLAKFDFDFTLNQKVHSIRKRLHHVITILDGTQRTVVALSSLSKAFQELGGIPTPVHDAFNRELSYISRSLEAYHSTTKELLNLSSDVKSTINSIIDFRNQGLLTENGAQLHRIAENNSRETRLMADTANLTYKDSRTMRIATVIALIYLPANLVMSFFSTVFVDMKLPVGLSGTGEATSADAHLQIYGQTWVAVVAMCALVLGTGSWFSFWDRKSHASRAPSTSTC